MNARIATLERIESFLPERRVSVDDLADYLGLSQSKLRMFRRMYGLRELRYDPNMSLFELVMPAAHRVMTTVAEPLQVRYMIFAHTTQALTPPHIDAAQVIKDELGLQHAEAFALTQQNCASGMGAVDVAAELLSGEAKEHERALVVTGERAFSPHVQVIPDTAIMGEAAAACLVGVNGFGDTIDSYVARTLGEYSAAMLLEEEHRLEFDRIYSEVLARVLRDAVGQAGLNMSDVALIVPHNVNTFSWRQTMKKLGLPSEMCFLDNVPRFSHCYASDVFVNYTTLRDTGRLVEGQHYLLASVGLGATFAAMVITH